MIEKFTSEELDIIMKEMKAHGYIKENTTKSFLLEKAKREADLIPYICPEIKKAMYDIADQVTNNYTIKKSKSNGIDRSFKNHFVPDEIQEKYSEVLLAMCKALMPYLNRYLEGVRR